MNTLDIASLQKDFATIKADLPCTVYYQNVAYSGLRSDIELTNQSVDPGMIRLYDAEVFISNSDLSGVDINQNFTIDGIKYKIDSIKPDPAAAVTSYRLVTINK